MFKRGGSGRQVTSQANAHQCDACGIHFWPRQEIVDDGCHNLFPIGTERQMLLADRRALTWAFKGQAVIAALDSSSRDEQVQLFACGVVPPVDQQGRARPERVVDSVEIPW